MKATRVFTGETVKLLGIVTSAGPRGLPDVILHIRISKSHQRIREPAPHETNIPGRWF